MTTLPFFTQTRTGGQTPHGTKPEPHRTVGDLIAHYTTDILPTKALSTQEGQTRTFRQILPDLGELSLVELTPAVLRQWRDQLRTRGLSPGTVRLYMDTLSAALTVGVKDLDWLLDHPMRKVRKPAESSGRVRFLTDEERTRLEACQALAQQEGYTVPETHIFVDDYTGTSLNRPQFTRLRDLVQQRLVQAVFVYDLDRLSRKLAHQLLLSEEFEQAGAALRIVTMPDEAKTPEAQLLTNVRGIIAEYERAKILERMARGRRGRAQAGYVPYGRRAFGYRYVKHADRGAHYEVHPEEGPLVQRIFRLYVEDRRSVEAIAVLLTQEGIPTPKDAMRTLPARIWHGSTIATILRNTTYIGTMYDGKKQRLPGKRNPDKKTRWRAVPREAWIAVSVLPLIDLATFEAAQAQLTRNKGQAKRNRKHEYLLVSGRLRCGQCGCAMTGEHTVQGTARYRCPRGKRAYKDIIAPHSRRGVMATAVEPVVWQAVERALHNPALIAAELERQREGTNAQQTDVDRERQHYTRQLAQCDKDLKRWEAAYLGEAIDLADFKAKKADIETRRASLEQELARLDAQQRLIEQAKLETASLMEYCARVRSKLHHLTLDEQR